MYKIAILISGSGTNMQALLDFKEEEGKKYNFDIEKVIADRPAKGLDIAKKRGYKSILLDKKALGIEKFNHSLFNELEDVDAIVLAGYLSILDKTLVQKFNGKIINIHPSLLPKYSGAGMYGLNVHKAVIEANEEESGCSVHLVDENIDTGKILLQKKVKVLKGDTPKDLSKRILVEEHKAIVEGLKILLNELRS